MKKFTTIMLLVLVMVMATGVYAAKGGNHGKPGISPQGGGGGIGGPTTPQGGGGQSGPKDPKWIPPGHRGENKPGNGPKSNANAEADAMAAALALALAAAEAEATSTSTSDSSSSSGASNTVTIGGDTYVNEREYASPTYIAGVRFANPIQGDYAPGFANPLAPKFLPWNLNQAIDYVNPSKSWGKPAWKKDFIIEICMRAEGVKEDGFSTLEVTAEQLKDPNYMAALYSAVSNYDHLGSPHGSPINFERDFDAGQVAVATAAMIEESHGLGILVYMTSGTLATLADSSQMGISNTHALGLHNMLGASASTGNATTLAQGKSYIWGIVLELKPGKELPVLFGGIAPKPKNKTVSIKTAQLIADWWMYPQAGA